MTPEDKRTMDLLARSKVAGRDTVGADIRASQVQARAERVRARHALTKRSDADRMAAIEKWTDTE